MTPEEHREVFRAGWNAAIEAAASVVEEMESLGFNRADAAAAIRGVIEPPHAADHSEPTP